MRSHFAPSLVLGAALAASACGSPTSSRTPSASAAPRTPPASAAPSATAVVPAGPFAVLVSNRDRAGTTYDVLLVDGSARLIARTTSRLPLIKPHQQFPLPLANASANGAFYLDGDTDIRLLLPSGATSLAKTIPQGTASLLAFAVSPDGQRAAVSVITQQAADSHTASHGYIEDLAGSGGHADIFSNTSSAAYRWPIAWYTSGIVDAVGNASCQAGGYGQGQPAGISCATSLHVVDAVTHARVATMCEAPVTPPSGVSVSWQLNGLVTPAGVVCQEQQFTSVPDPSQPGTSICTVAAVDLHGGHRNFLSSSCDKVDLSNCFLAPDGSRMACTSQTNEALGFLTPGGVFHSLGRKYTVLGWIDASHLMVDVDASSVAVLDASTGVATTLALPGADQVEMLGVAAGS